MPVVVVFAISMSLIFLSLTVRINLIDNVDSCTKDSMSILGAKLTCPNNDSTKRCYDFYGVTTLCFSE